MKFLHEGTSDMEFNEKLQMMRKQKGLTQEELAEKLFVSRTAISKWESGRGYPNIDSLKAISKFFSVTIDELLSGEEILSIAEEDNQQREKCLVSLLFGLLDLGFAVLLFLPFFGQTTGDGLQSVSLLALTGVQTYLKAVYFAAVVGMTALGIAALALQNWQNEFWVQNRSRISLAFNMVTVILMILSRQPYTAVYSFVFLAIKVWMLLKRR